MALYQQATQDGIEALIARRMSALTLAKAHRNGRRLPKPPVPPRTKMVELFYFRSLKAMVDAMIRLTEEIILPAIDPISKAAKALNDRSDDYVDDLAVMRDQFRLAFYRAYSNREIVDMAVAAAHHAAQQNANYFNRLSKRLGVEIVQIEPWLEPKIRAFTRYNVQLITSIPEDHLRRVEGSILRGVQRGALNTTIARDIRDTFPLAENKARLIARDQVAKFNAALTKTRQTAIGITHYRWSTSRDERVRLSHAANEGRIFAWDKPPAETGHPGEDINCRCVAIPVLE